MGAIVVASLILHFMPTITTFLLFGISGWAFYRYAKWQIARNDMKAVEREALSRRAEEQDAAFYAGEPAGLYGEYEPYTMPIPKDWYDYQQ